MRIGRCTVREWTSVLKERPATAGSVLNDQPRNRRLIDTFPCERIVMEVFTVKDERDSRPGDIHSDHRAAHEDHAAWLEDLERWRAEYREALMDLARRLIPELELQNYEAALDRHEAAIQAHEDLLRSHEEAVDFSRRAGDRAAEEYETVHAQLDGRHLRSRDLHQHLDRTHRAVLRAIAMVAKEI